MKVLFCLLLLTSCVDCKTPTPRYSLGDKVSFKQTPFYAKACYNVGTITDHQFLNKEHRYYNVHVDYHLKGHDKCPYNYSIHEDDIIKEEK
jgi:hypothetical protein